MIFSSPPQDRGLSGLRKGNRDANEGSKDYSLLVYSSLLQNEVLGAGIEDFKEATEERRALSPAPVGSNNLFSVSFQWLQRNCVRKACLKPATIPLCSTRLSDPT